MHVNVGLTIPDETGDIIGAISTAYANEGTEGAILSRVLA